MPSEQTCDHWKHTCWHGLLNRDLISDEKDEVPMNIYILKLLQSYNKVKEKKRKKKKEICGLCKVRHNNFWMLSEKSYKVSASLFWFKKKKELTKVKVKIPDPCRIVNAIGILAQFKYPILNNFVSKQS